ncbi:MAG TPA: molybdopterin-synthase adenylyltransferase MoeB [Methylococcaceae bacterium]|nr:molybdopterin-synthase adenylyltransferase MoeB [Methylococcaceae bacterium]
MNDGQLLRYSRQLMLPQIDVAGQEKLLASRILIIGAGGLGSPAALYLTAAGIGELVICDDDTVDLSNLQRQILHDSSRLGWNKAESARWILERVNPDSRIVPIDRRLQGVELDREAARADVVLDCSDNFPTRFAVNAACVKTGTPLVSGAVIRFEGQLAVFTPGTGESPCYRCLYPEGNDEAEANCVRNGIVAPLPGIIGSLQALEAIKLLLKLGAVSSGRLQLFDALTLEWREMKFARAQDCPVCKKQT